VRRVLFLICVAPLFIQLVSCSGNLDATSISMAPEEQVIERTPTEIPEPVSPVNKTAISQDAINPATPTSTMPPVTREAPIFSERTATTPSLSSTATEVPPCYQATFIRDVSYADGTGVMPGEIFLKVWRFRNDGSCEWNRSFLLEFERDERFSGPDRVKINYFEEGADLELVLGDRRWIDLKKFVVQPGDTVDIPLALRAPLEEGRHRGSWRVLAQDGKTVVLRFYIDVDVEFTLEQENGRWGGEWSHENQSSETLGSPLVFDQKDRQIEGYYYDSEGEILLIDASLSSDKTRMEGSFGQAWQTGWPFVLQLYPNQKVFNGYYNDSSFTGGAWCGSRPGYSVPLGGCLLSE
jgi:hypothetical protein